MSKPRPGVGFEITTPIPTANVYLRMHWAKRRKLQHALDDDVWCARIELGDRCNSDFFGAKVKRSVTITMYRKRLQDVDNAVTSCKALIDSLRRSGFIWDDAPQWLELKVQQVVDKGKTFVWVEVK
jgi:Holliday junction resolvase RusA-like endonuclease